MSNQLSVVLIDEDDIDVVALHETLETVFNLTHGSVWKFAKKKSFFMKFSQIRLDLTVSLTLVDHHEVWMTILVDLTNSTEKESNASILKNFVLEISIQREN